MQPSGPRWDSAFESRCQALVADVVNSRGPARLRAWQALLVAAAPHVERWAAKNRVLRALRLTGEDDLRAVLVRVVERLQRQDYANLRSFLEGRASAARALAEAEGDDAEVARFCELAAAVDDDADEAFGTPLRAWLKGLTDFAARDQATARVGRSDRERTPGDTGGKRAPNSGAKPISEGDEPNASPGMTDWLTLKRLAAEIVSYAEANLSPDQQTALKMRLGDATYGEIADRLELPRPQAAEALVRAAKERLRLQFRAQRGRFGFDDDEPSQPR